MSEPVLMDIDEGVATLTLNEPDRMNPLTGDVSAELGASLDELATREDVRCVVIEGAGAAFSAGGDIQKMNDRIESDAALDDAVDDIERGLNRTMVELVDCPYPTVAKVDGPAVGAGANLAIGCDVVLANEDASIGFVFNQVGLSVDGGTSYLLPRIVGVNVAKELVLTGEILDAERAADLRLFNHVYANDQFEDEVEAKVKRIASGPTIALRHAKRLVQNGIDKPLERALEDEATAQGVVFDTETTKKGSMRSSRIVRRRSAVDSRPNRLPPGTPVGRPKGVRTRHDRSRSTPLTERLLPQTEQCVAMARSRQALEDVTVVGISQTISGPACEAFLGDFGADVIKVEPIDGGEPFRRSIQERNGVGFNMAFEVFNRNKRSVAVDLKSDRGVEVMYDLIEGADIFVQNFSPGVVERLGLDYETLTGYNDDLIYLSISGYGTEGEWANKPAFDNLIQQMSGFSSLHQQEGERPTMIKLWISDFFASYNAALSGLAALHHRENGGGGQKCEISMFQSLAHAMNARFEKYRNLGEVPEVRGPNEKAPLMNSIEETKDGWIGIAFVPAYPKIWDGFCELLDREDLLDHPDFANPEDRRQGGNLPELNELMREWLLEHESREAVELLNEHGIPAAPHNSVPDAVEDGPIRFTTVDSPRIGPLDLTETPLDLSETPPEVSRPAPGLGAHSEEVLSDVGYSTAEIRTLHEEDVLGGTE